MTAYQSSNQQSDTFTHAKVEDAFEMMIGWIEIPTVIVKVIELSQTFKNVIRLGYKKLACSINISITQAWISMKQLCMLRQIHLRGRA